LALFFLLSDCKFGNCYPIEALTRSQKQLVNEFSKIGLIYMRNILSTRFYPTQVAINMLFKSVKTSDEELEKDKNERNNGNMNDKKTAVIRIIVETNLQVIAYVTSDLHLAMLKLFVDLSVRMPNMAMGKITRGM
jgi:transcription initiation factor TFIIH subunit 4